MKAGFRLRDDCAGLVAAALGPLALYALTLPRTVVLEDDGLFLMAGEHLGVAHPPGYPLYTLLCHLFMRLPGNPAVLGHLSSAVLGALACAAIYACARLLGSSFGQGAHPSRASAGGAGRLVALGAAWLFGASGHFWSQAIIAEVYTLNALAFFASYALILRAVANAPAPRPGRARAHGTGRTARIGVAASWPWIGAAAAFGFGLANHWPLMVLAAPGLALAAWPARRVLLGNLLVGPNARQVPMGLLLTLAAAVLICAAAPYLAMVLRSWQEPLVSFYGPIRDWDAFWFYVSRSGYADVDASPGAGWLDRLLYLGWFCKQLLWQLTIPGCALAAVGLLVLLRAKRFVDAASGTVALLGNSVLLIGLLGFDYDAYNISVFRPYSLVCYGILALWLALGAQFLLDRLPRAVQAARGAPAAVAALAGVTLVAVSVAAGWHENNRKDSVVTERHAELLLSLLPENTVFFVYGDTEVGPLGYFRLVEERREDVELFSGQGLVFGNRILDPLASDARKRAALRQFVAATDRPLFYATSDSHVPHGRGIRHYGFVKEVLRHGRADQLELRVHPASVDYFGELVRSTPVDGWEKRRRNELVFKYGEYLGYVVLAANAELLAQTRQAREVAEQSFFSLLGMAEVVLEHGTESHLAQIAQIEQWLAKAERLQAETRTKERRARLLYMQGYVNARAGRMEQAVALFKASRNHYPHPENAAVAALKQLGR